MRHLILLYMVAGCGPAPTPSPRRPTAPPAKPAPAPTSISIVSAPVSLGGEQPSRWATRFPAAANSSEAALVIRHAETSGQSWAISVNGTRVGYLQSADATYLPVPADTIVSGDNSVDIIGFRVGAPLVVRSIELVPRPARELMKLGAVRVTVSESRTGTVQPSRITIVDAANSHRVSPVYTRGANTATRHGVVYSTGDVTIELAPGRYRLFATRGTEWSMAGAAIEVREGDTTEAQLSITREIDTSGFIAADTHVHTLTFSGHGNASVAERLVTLAGEGVELAVATDHNHNTDYGPEQRRLELSDYFLAITGNEVSTSVGHFNGFPLDPNEEVPDKTLIDLVKIVDDIRSRGAKIVTLNHPRFPLEELSVFGKGDLNHVTGDAVKALVLTVDAIELANTNTRPDDPLLMVADWLALLNRGVSVTAVGVSDSHTVEDPPGEGRTYVRSTTDDVTALDENELYESIKAGRASVSVGIFTDARTSSGGRPGDTVAITKAGATLSLRVAAPSWITPRTAFVFANGQRIAERAIDVEPGKPTDTTLEISLDRPAYDTHVVCVVVGDPVTHPAWTTRRPYTMGATNPIYLDADGDGRYRSPRDSARRVLAKYKGDLRRVERALPRLDPVIAAQMLSLIRERIDGLIADQGKRMRLAIPEPHTHTH